MKNIFIINPSAGKADAKARVMDAINDLGRKIDYETYLTRGGNDARTYVAQYCETHPEEELLFIACGGDGTLSEVFNGAYGHKNATVSCFPCGSGNDFVKYFGGEERFTGLRQITEPEYIDIDLMKVNDVFSNNVINFGFDSTVAIEVNKGRERNGHAGKGLYTLGIIKAIVTSMHNRCKVYADGELLDPEGEMLLCTLGNGSYVGGSFKCAPKAVINDQLIEVCLVKPISRLKLVSFIGIYTRGDHLDSPDLAKHIVYRQARHVRVTAPSKIAYSVDGEIFYDDDFEIEIIPEAVRFCYAAD